MRKCILELTRFISAASPSYLSCFINRGGDCTKISGILHIAMTVEYYPLREKLWGSEKRQLTKSTDKTNRQRDFLQLVFGARRDFIGVRVSVSEFHGAMKERVVRKDKTVLQTPKFHRLRIRSILLAENRLLISFIYIQPIGAQDG